MAYRYFATPRRKFIIADTPGHEQYTRNMATGASTADLADRAGGCHARACCRSRAGTLTSHRCWGCGTFVVAVNKMDLVDFSEDVFLQLEQDIHQLNDSTRHCSCALHTHQRAGGR